jgi:competence protein ComEC
VPTIPALLDRLRPLLRQEPLPPRPLVAVSGCLIAGAVAVRWLPLLDAVSLAVPCWVAAVLTVPTAVWARRCRRESLAAGLLLVSVGLAGAAWSAARFDLFSRDDLAWQCDTTPVPVAIRATLLEAPRLLAPPLEDPRRAAGIGPASGCLVGLEAVRDGRSWRAAAGRATVIVRGEPAGLVTGSRVQIFGQGLRPTPALNPGEFDFALRSRSERCLSLVRVDSWDCVTVLSPPSRWSLWAALDRLRSRAAAALASGIAAERLPLATALLLGHRESLSRAAAADFVVTGTIHVLAISGLHVGLLAAGLFGVLRCLLVPRGVSIIVVAAIIGLYCMLVGAGTPVVRATLLVWAACLAAIAGRRPATINALAGAAILLVAWRPAEVLSAGAQLSFLSTAVLVGVAKAIARPRSSDPIERLIERSRSGQERWLRRLGGRTTGLAVSGLAVWLVAAPLVAARFHVVSPIAVLANLLIAPLVPVAMACGLLCLATAAVFTPVAVACAIGCDAVLAGIEGVTAAAASLTAGHAWVAGPAGWWVAGWYALLAAAVVWGRRELLVRGTTWATLVVGWIAVGLVGSGIAGWMRAEPPGLRVVAAAVGHGCGILVKAPTGRCLLYDAGRLGSPAAAGRSLSAVLWSEGVTRIDTLVISHADADHFNAVPDLLQRFGVGEILVPRSFLATRSRLAQDLLAAAERAGVPVRTGRAGESFPLDPLCRVRVLHPADGSVATSDPSPRDPGVTPLDDNASSLVLSVEAAGRRLLLTGDLEGPALAAFNASGPGECDVLVAPHHGTRTSLPADIARVTKPGLVLVSGRGGRAWPEVREDYAKATVGGAAAVLKTGGEGALAVTLTAAGIGVERFSAGCWGPPADAAQAVAARDGLVNSQPAASSTSWLATYAPSRSNTPVVKP